MDNNQMQQRAMALDMAVRFHSTQLAAPSEVASTAKEFYNFLTGKAEEQTNG